MINELDEIEASKKNAKIQQVRNDIVVVKADRDGIKD